LNNGETHHQVLKTKKDGRESIKLMDDYLHEENVEINGFLFYAHEITPTESYSRREFNRTNILGGTTFISKGAYVPCEYTFTSDLNIDPTRPDMYDKVFAYINNNPCKVVSKYMGMFTAEVKISKTHNKSSPGNISLSISVKEIPEVKVEI
jgi:hypothetical protein